MATDELEITIEIACSELPSAGQDALLLGIQRDNEVIEAVSADTTRIVFKPTLRARRNPDGSVNFLGPFAQGPKAERFVYLNWMTAKSGVLTGMMGRIKLHLNHIKWADVKKAADANKPIRVKLALTNAKGKPVMASVRPDAAKWEIQ